MHIECSWCSSLALARHMTPGAAPRDHHLIWSTSPHLTRCSRAPRVTAILTQSNCRVLLGHNQHLRMLRHSSLCFRCGLTAVLESVAAAVVGWPAQVACQTALALTSYGDRCSRISSYPSAKRRKVAVVPAKLLPSIHPVPRAYIPATAAN